MASGRKSFWSSLPGLIWSNPDADDSAYIRAALLKPRIDYLLPIAIEFGIDRLRSEWTDLADEDIPAVRTASPHVERILRNIEKGFAHAAARN